MSPGLLLTFGSARQAAALADLYGAAGWAVGHVDDRADGSPATESAMSARAGRLLVDVDHGGRVDLVSVPRASVQGSGPRIARVWRGLRDGHDATVWAAFGPSPGSAAIFDDKWATYQHLVRWGVPAVPSRLITVAELGPMTEATPVVVKLRDRTGGVGVVGGRAGDDLAAQVAAFADQRQEVLVARFVDGFEVSVKALVHDGIWPVAVVVKERTRLPVVHGDWKIKVAFPLTTREWAYEVVRAVAEGADAGGFLSVEGIWEPGPNRFLVCEVANRRTGSFTIADAVSTVGRSAPAIHRLLRGGRPIAERAGYPVAATVAVESRSRAFPAAERAADAGCLLGTDAEPIRRW